jgi:ABC-2 type transport system ATP-binding protein
MWRKTLEVFVIPEKNSNRTTALTQPGVIMTKLIEADHVFRYFGAYCAVHDLSFSLAKGQVLGFLGVNGAGKTTTMQLLCGLLAPSSGHILINGYNVLTHPILAKQSLGYLPDTPPLYRDLTVSEFLRYCAQLHNIPTKQCHAAVHSALGRCSLGAVQHKLISQLSKGFQQRVGIAQAIIHNPDLIILDEPSVGLDPIQIQEIHTLIKELGQTHGVILSTHRLSEVQESCTDVQIIHDGKLILQKNSAELAAIMSTEKLCLRTRLALDPATLTANTDITHITVVSTQHLEIHYHANANPTPKITEQLIAAGVDILELSPIKKSMEDMFIELIQENSK